MSLTLAEAKKRYPPMWTIYDHPRDYPDHFVVRLWYGEIATLEFSLHPTLTEARERCATNGGSVPLQRMPGDDPCIVEVWL